ATVAGEATGLGQTSSNSCLSLFVLFRFKHIKRQAFAKRDAKPIGPKSLVRLQLDLAPENNDGFPKTVHELLIVPETGIAYVPIFGDGIHGRNPNPQHLLCVLDLHKRAHATTIDLRPYIAPHALKLGPDGLIYITCENSAVVAVIDRAT